MSGISPFGLIVISFVGLHAINVALQIRNISPVTTTKWRAISERLRLAFTICAGSATLENFLRNTATCFNIFSRLKFRVRSGSKCLQFLPLDITRFCGITFPRCFNTLFAVPDAVSGKPHLSTFRLSVSEKLNFALFVRALTSTLKDLDRLSATNFNLLSGCEFPLVVVSDGSERDG